MTMQNSSALRQPLDDYEDDNQNLAKVIPFPMKEKTKTNQEIVKIIDSGAVGSLYQVGYYLSSPNFEFSSSDYLRMFSYAEHWIKRAIEYEQSQKSF